MAENGNGKNGSAVLSWRWALSLFVSAFVMVGGWAWSSTIDRVIQLEQTVQTRGERVASLEAQVQALTATLRRIEEKLDRVIEDRR